MKNSCGHHKGRIVIAVLEGDLMENPCWVEGVGAISRPSGTLSYRIDFFLSFFLSLFFFFNAFSLIAHVLTSTLFRWQKVRRHYR